MTRSRLSLFLCIGALLVGSTSLLAQEDQDDAGGSLKLSSSQVSALRFRSIGPALMSGRISDIAVDPVRRSTWYVAAASGGVWKTVNAGTTWTPIFDSYGSYSVGCVAVDPNNRHVVWVGTGENNSQRSVGYGDGLYKSVDGGKSFQHVGLKDSQHIAKVLIDPRDSNVVFVAAQGPLWNSGGDRGLYKTTDGGKTWTPILTVDDDTGVTDIHFDPRDPDTIYAATYQRRRHVWTLINGGPGSGVHKSTDGGATWRALKRGLPSGDIGRIGMTISPIDPDMLYAVVEAADDQGGFFRSVDRGETWSRQSSYVSGSPQYYQEIVADPHVLGRVYSLDTYMMVSEDHGRTFQQLGESNKHVDNHALIIDPDDADHLLIGCDGGVYETWDRGQTYDFKPNLPLTQFYKLATDNAEPFYNIYGGTQDNATQGGPSQTKNVQGIRNSDWFITVFGDGFDPAVDPEDPNIVYSQWQYGGLIRFDRRTGERIDIKPQPEKDGPPLRWNWDSALLISPHAPNRIYYASQILFRSDDRGTTWEAISPDLTRNMDRNKLKVMGRIWSVDAVAKNRSTSFYGTIVALAESPVTPNLLYAGSDDGLIQVSEDGGGSWRKIEEFDFLEVPAASYINDLEASLHDGDTIYAAVNNHKNGDFKPYLVKSTDRGKNWTLISSGLPERGSVYTIVEDHEDADILFAGTEFGVFTTVDGGRNWTQLKSGMPTIAVRELEIQRRENDLVAATFGRGFYVLDDYSPLREMSAEVFKQPAVILPVKPAQAYIQSAPLALGGKAFQGAGFFTADNPPFGATFTYHLRDSYQSQQAKRRADEKRKAKDGQDVHYPSWEDLKAEDREEADSMWLVIHDEAGNVVRRLPASNSKGTHRTTWNLRHPGSGPVQAAGDGYGPMAVPGKYTVSLVQVDEAEAKPMAGPVEFEVVPMGFQAMSESDRNAAFKFQQETANLQRAVLAAVEVANQADQQVDLIKRAIEISPQLPLEMRKEARDLELRLLDIRERFSGDPTKPRRSEPAMPGILSRIQTVVRGHWANTIGPTSTHRRNYEIAAEEFREVLVDLRKLVETDLVALSKKLDEAGAPWTPGRRIPDFE